MNKYTEYLDYVESLFDEHFSKNGYLREKPVAVSSRVDPTVDFVGSKISPLKHLVVNDIIAPQGHYLIQDCFRTKGMKKLKTLDPSKFGSCFRTMGTLTQPSIEKAIFDTFNYLINGIGIKPQDLLIKINPDDKDLVTATRQVVGNIRQQENATDANYRHRYGLDEQEIYGRDFNIGVRKQGTDEFISAGTIVLMEQLDRKIGVDMGIGNLTLAMCNFAKDNTLAVSRMADVINVDSIETQRFADSLIGLALLQKEGIRNLPTTKDRTSKNFRWKFKKYEDAVVFWKLQFGLNDEQVLDYMKRYIDLEFKNNTYKSEATWER